MSSLAPSPGVSYEQDREQCFVLHNVSWQEYETLRETLDAHRGLRLLYLKGTLELRSPSRRHELVKTMVARLLEQWALECDVPLNGYGSWTLKNRLVERGLEPDECYCLGEVHGEVPDLAIEVVLSHGVVDQLAIYAGLGVSELWVWEKGSLQVLRLEEGVYRPHARSVLLPALDLELLLRFVDAPDQTRAVRAYRDALRAAGR